MRIALITIDDADGDDGLILGKSVAEHQLEFAVAAGCDALIVMGDAHSSAVFRLRHTAENYGIKFRTITITHNLLGAVGSGDELLVFDQNILPANEGVLARLSRGSAIITLAADPGTGLGFERIDAVNAWAGVMLIPGRLVENLAQLPRDCEASAALLRIALQAKVLTENLGIAALSDGTWQRMAADETAAAEGRLIDHRLGTPPAGDVTGWIANKLAHSFAHKLFRQRSATKLLGAGAIGLAAVGVIAAFYGSPLGGFFAVGSAAVLARMTGNFGRLTRVGADPATTISANNRYLFYAVDIALALCAIIPLATDSWQAAYPPVILLALLHTLSVKNGAAHAQLFHDRAVLCLAFAVAAGLGYLTPVIMAASLILLGSAKYRSIKGQT